MKIENLGWCMAGNEEAFAEYLDLALDGHTPPFVYMEIGLGVMTTFCAIDRYLFGKCQKHHRMIGVDRPECLLAANNGIVLCPGQMSIFPQFHMTGSSAFWQTNPEPAHFIFIDGCHTYECSKADFIGAEKCARPGSVIAFHDIGQEVQGADPQPHCNGKPVDVRRAIEDLGLLSGRDGWKFLKETEGDKARGGRGCMFFQRI